MLTKEERIFALKTFYKSGATAVVNEWGIHFRSKPPSRQTVYDIRDRFEQHGSVMDAPRSGRPTTVSTDDNLLRVCLAVTKSPRKSTRRLASELHLSRRSVQRMLHKQNYKCYIPRLLHGLLEDDPDRRLQFCELMLNQHKHDPNLFNKIIWSDEANFKLSGQVNRHNCTYWFTDNQHLVSEQQLNQPGVSVWGAISSFGVLGPYFFEGTVTGDKYLDMLQNYAVPGLMTLAENFQELYFQHDGAPPHYATAVRNYLNERFQRKVIGRRADIDMPPRSPDITPMDFFVWGVVKDSVYSRKPHTIDELKDYIHDAFHDLDSDPTLCRRVCNSVPERLEICINEDGKQFEHKK